MLFAQCRSGFALVNPWIKNRRARLPGYRCAHGGERNQIMGRYNPKTVLRQTSNSLLREFFAIQGVRTTIQWDELRETKIDPIFEALQRLPEKERQAIDIVLQDIHLIASSDAGIQQLIRENRSDGFAETLENFDSRYDKALWAYMNSPDTFGAAVRFYASDTLSKRYWHARKCQAIRPDCSEEATVHLQILLSGFYVETQGRGHHCLVEHLRRSDVYSDN